jgi:hypothetical protein
MIAFADSHLTETIDFPYDAIDGEQESAEDEFLAVQAEFLMQLVQWATEPRNSAAVGQRVLAITAIMRPDLLPKTKRRRTKTAVDANMVGAMTVLERKFGPKFRRFQNGHAANPVS